MAIDFTLAYPTRVGRLILVGSALSGTPQADVDPFADRAKAINEAGKSGQFELMNELEIQLWVDGPYRTPEQVDPSVRRLALEMNGQAIALDNPNAEFQPPADPAYSRLAEINSPTLIIAGDGDLPRILTTADKLKAEIVGAKKVLMQGVAHLPNMEKPDEFNRLVLDFLKS